MWELKLESITENKRYRVKKYNMPTKCSEAEAKRHKKVPQNCRLLKLSTWVNLLRYFITGKELEVLQRFFGTKIKTLTYLIFYATTFVLFWMLLPEVTLFVTTAALTHRLDSNQKYLWFPLRFPAALRASYLRHGLKWQERIDQPIDPARLTLTTSATPGQNNKMWGWRSAPCALSGRNVCAPIWIQKHIITFFHPYHAVEVKLRGQAWFREEMRRKGLCEATSSGDSCSLEWTHPPKTKDIWHFHP